ncbi:MAG: EF-P lysine aminoacylase EpmA [Methylococcales bacterium]
MLKDKATYDWQAACSLDVLQLRAQMLSQLRVFFAQRHVLEVETPALYPFTNPDPMIEGFEVSETQHYSHSLYLQTSPEFAMKRLLAAGSGAIYQVCRAYRKSEAGRYHNPEFTILEWYRPGYTLHQLMQEVAELLVEVLPVSCLSHQAVYLTYQSVFSKAVGIDPLSASINDFVLLAQTLGYSEAQKICADNRSTWLDFLFSHVVQPSLPQQRIVFVYNYPACQSALARLHPQQPEVAERVEVFIDGVELGNGFQELTDSEEQRQRFIRQQRERAEHGMIVPSLDESFLAALEAGVPETSGIAIGLDRLLMLASGVDDISQVLTFPLR